MGTINWSTEWLTSLLWVLRTFAFVIIGFALVGWLLIKRTRWGRQFWRISGMYFRPYRRGFLAWRPILTVLLLLLLTIAGVRLDVILSFSNNGLFTALQERNQADFWRYVIIFGVIAAINVVLALISFYIAQAQIIHWRLWLNQRMLGDWLTGSAYHRGRFVAEQIDNPDQRIQQDVTSFAGTSQGLALGAVSSMVSLVSFSIVLWGLSGPLTVFGITIPRANGLPRLPLCDHRDPDRVQDRQAVDQAQLPQRTVHRFLPLRPRQAAGELREHRLLSRRAGSRTPA